MSLYKTTGFVLNKRRVGNTSLVATLYTRDFGKLKAILKGFETRKPLYVSRMETLSLNEIVFYGNKKSPYSIVSECTLLDHFGAIRQSLETIAYASYLVELLDRMTVFEDGNEELFNLLFTSFTLMPSLSSISNGFEMAARVFEVKLINLIGIKPGWLDWIKFSNLTVSQGALNSLTYIENEDFGRLTRLRISPNTALELKGLLSSLLDYHLEKRLNSNKWLECIFKT